jgi:hypothetical protein
VVHGLDSNGQMEMFKKWQHFISIPLNMAEPNHNKPNSSPSTHPSAAQIRAQYGSLLLSSTLAGATLGSLSGSIYSLVKGTKFFNSTARCGLFGAAAGLTYSGITMLSALHLGQKSNTFARNLFAGTATGAITAGCVGGTKYAVGGAGWGAVIGAIIYVSTKTAQQLNLELEQKHAHEISISPDDRPNLSDKSENSEKKWDLANYTPSWIPVHRSTAEDLDKLKQKRVENRENPEKNNFFGVAAIDNSPFQTPEALIKQQIKQLQAERAQNSAEEKN